MKTLMRGILGAGALFLALGCARLGAQTVENRYDVLAKAITPFTSLFAKDAGPRAMRLDFTLGETSGLPAGVAGASFHIALQTPDRFLASGPLLGKEMTLCRNQQDLWAAPGAEAQAWITQISNPAKQPAGYKLGRIELPIPQNEMILLPALFQVRENAPEAVNGVDCRVLDLALAPQMAKRLNVESWSVRAWIGPDYKPARLEIFGPKWHATANIEHLDYPASLPPETWQPAPDQAADAMHLTAPQYKQLFDAAAGLIGGRRKEK